MRNHLCKHCRQHNGKERQSASRGVKIRKRCFSEFTATAVWEGLEGVGVKSLLIAPGSPWENGYVESSNGKLGDELLNG